MLADNIDQCKGLINLVNFVEYILYASSPSGKDGMRLVNLGSSRKLSTTFLDYLKLSIKIHIARSPPLLRTQSSTHTENDRQ